MKRTLTGFAILAVYIAAIVGVSFVAGGGLSRVSFDADAATHPPVTIVRQQPGNRRDTGEVSCTTVGDIALVTAAQTKDAMSVYFYNTDASNPVTICPRAAGSGQCNTIAKGLTVKAGVGFTDNVTVEQAPWSCLGVGGTVVVEWFVERWSDPDFNPTATPMPSLTPTPSPTPTPT